MPAHTLVIEPEVPYDRHDGLNAAAAVVPVAAAAWGGTHRLSSVVNDHSIDASTTFRYLVHTSYNSLIVHRIAESRGSL